jgi:hypothetical protein
MPIGCLPDLGLGILPLRIRCRINQAIGKANEQMQTTNRGGYRLTE